jgi:DNA-binding NtrC family response regulator
MPEIRGRVLVIDADGASAALCREALEAAGFRAIAVDGPARALERLRREAFDAALLETQAPGPAGLEALAILRRESPHLPVIVITGHPSFPAAVDAVKAGAFDYVPRPFPPETLPAAVERAIRSSRRALEDACIGRELEREPHLPPLIGRSAAMAPVIRLIQAAAATDGAVLITGERGVGKEVVARTIHRMSRRSSRRFVKVDCDGIAESALEEELFGPADRAGAGDRVRGKIELADGGTLYLEGTGGLGLPLQRRLRRLVLERESARSVSARSGSAERIGADVRLVFSSTQSPAPAGRKTRPGRMFDRLRALHIPVPPLRERRGDIPALADYTLRALAREKGRGPRALSEEALRSLERREWPGNVRELIRLLEHAAGVCPAATLRPEDLAGEAPEPGASPEGRLARVERGEILAALDRFGGNRTRTAGYLGIHRKTLREKMGRYRIGPCPEK